MEYRLLKTLVRCVPDVRTSGCRTDETYSLFLFPFPKAEDCLGSFGWVQLAKPPLPIFILCS